MTKAARAREFSKELHKPFDNELQLLLQKYRAAGFRKKTQLDLIIARVKNEQKTASKLEEHETWKQKEMARRKALLEALPGWAEL